MAYLRGRAWCALLSSYCLEDLACEDGEGGALEILVDHVAGDDLVVFGHALDHEVLDELADAQLEFVQWIGERGAHDVFASAGPLLDLLEEEPVLLVEPSPEALIQDVDDL